ncbi:MAG TPA: hypothetical protein VMS64_04830 [Candidatus Methylomirabilis sp.]|nr:hypothetical protein [Candidatus Methylomirabilis sp.]
MSTDKFEQALAALEPSKRALLKGIVAGAAFAVPTVASFAVSDLAYGQVGSCSTFTTTLPLTVTTATTLIVTVTTVSVTFTTTTTTESSE